MDQSLSCEIAGTLLTRRVREILFRASLAYFHWFALVMFLVPSVPRGVATGSLYEQPMDRIGVGTLLFIVVHTPLAMVYALTRRRVRGFESVCLWVVTGLLVPILPWFTLGWLHDGIQLAGVEWVRPRAIYLFFGELQLLTQMPLILATHVAAVLGLFAIRTWVNRETDE